MFTTEQIDRLLNQGANVLSEDGEKIGSIGQVFVDNVDGQPSWVTVRTGLFGMSESFVPLEGARTEGNDIVVPYSKDHVKDAPRIDADRPLEPAEEDRLYQHYQLDTGRTYTEATTDTAGSGPGPERTGAPAEQRDTAPDHTAAPAAGGTSGYDNSASTEQRGTAPDHTAAPAAAPPSEQRETAAPHRTGAPVGAGTAGFDTGTSSEQRDAAPDRTTATGTSGYDTAARDRTGAPVAATAAATGAGGTTAQRDTAAADRAQGPTAAAGAGGTTAQRDTAAADRAQGPIAAAGAGGTAQRDTAAADRAQAPTAAGAGTTAQRDTAQRDTGAASAPGRGRLRKYVTTEQVTKTVPVQREEVRIEREPITDENRDEASNRPDKDDEHDMILHEERVIVTKETVPVERVHIGTETVTENVTIKENVRKEHIDTDGPEEGRG
jgi:uncharacterized protein (TIGR02271 family)